MACCVHLSRLSLNQPASLFSAPSADFLNSALKIFGYSDMCMVFVLDNYDSFTYNMVQYLGELGEVVVRRNDQITVAG